MSNGYNVPAAKMIFISKEIADALIEAGFSMTDLVDRTKIESILSKTEVKNLMAYNGLMLSAEGDTDPRVSLLSNFIATAYLDLNTTPVDFQWIRSEADELDYTSTLVPQVLHYDGDCLVVTVLETNDRGIIRNIMRKNCKSITDVVSGLAFIRSPFMTDVIKLLD